MRKLLAVVVYTFIVLLIGRNLVMLPKFTVFSSKESQQEAFSKSLKQQTQKLLSSVPGNYGVYYADFNSNAAFGINEKEMLTGASVNKVPIVAVLYYLDHKGKIDLDKKITLQAEDIQAYGTGSLQYQKPGTVYSFQTLAKLALQQSDNTAAHIIAKEIGMPVIQQTIEKWGLKQTDMEKNKTTAYDMYLLFKKLYKAEITSVAKTQELFGFLIDTDIEDRLPALLPSGANVYHKTGDGIGVINDVGIIQHNNKIFFLGILASDIGDKEAQTKQTIAKIAKNIIDEYEKWK